MFLLVNVCAKKVISVQNVLLLSFLVLNLVSVAEQHVGTCLRPASLLDFNYNSLMCYFILASLSQMSVCLK